MILKHKGYTIERVKDLTMDTVLKVNGYEIRFNYKYAASFRDGAGFLSTEAAGRMFDEAIDEYNFVHDHGWEFIGNGRGV